MRTNNTQKLTVYALFLAIMLVMGLVPGLGFIPTPFAAIVIIQVPVILASYFLGYKGGIIFGAVFGITSIINCFIQPDAFAAIILSSKGIMPLILMLVCLLIPRILIGVTTRACFNLFGNLFKRFDKTKALAMGISAFVGTLTNTVLFLGAFFLFAREACIEQFALENTKALLTTMLGVVTFNGLIEAATSVILCVAIGQALYRFYFKKHPMDGSRKL